MGKQERRARRRERLIERWEASGESAARFARRARVSVATLWYWKRRAGEKAVKQKLVPVQLFTEPAEGREAPRVELVLVDGRRLLIPSDVPTDGLVSILRALSTC